MAAKARKVHLIQALAGVQGGQPVRWRAAHLRQPAYELRVVRRRGPLVLRRAAHQPLLASVRPGTPLAEVWELSVSRGVGLPEAVRSSTLSLMEHVARVRSPGPFIPTVSPFLAGRTRQPNPSIERTF